MQYRLECVNLEYKKHGQVIMLQNKEFKYQHNILRSSQKTIDCEHEHLHLWLMLSLLN